MSDIEWTDETWTPFRAWGNEREAVGWACEKVSEGCQHCYAETINRRLGTGLPYSVKAVEKSGGEHYLDEKALLKPLSWKKPRRIFVSSMTDIFGEWVPFDWLDRVFAVMALTPQHTYQVLTKRPERMREYLGRDRIRKHPTQSVWHNTRGQVSWAVQALDGPNGLVPWPLPNVWLGTSVENQHWADIRILELLATPAPVRFLSCEPLLGPLDFAIPQTHGVLYPLLGECSRYEGPDGDEGSGHIIRTPNRGNMPLEDYLALPPSRIDWVIVGGESGPKARPFDLAWARSIVSQCRAAGVPVFVKQLGAKPFTVGDDGPGVRAPRSYKRAYPDEAGRFWLDKVDRKGGDMAEWPEDLRVREWPGGAM